MLTGLSKSLVLSTRFRPRLYLACCRSSRSDRLFSLRIKGEESPSISASICSTLFLRCLVLLANCPAGTLAKPSTSLSPSHTGCPPRMGVALSGINISSIHSSLSGDLAIKTLPLYHYVNLPTSLHRGCHSRLYREKQKALLVHHKDAPHQSSGCILNYCIPLHYDCLGMQRNFHIHN